MAPSHRKRATIAPRLPEEPTGAGRDEPAQPAAGQAAGAGADAPSRQGREPPADSTEQAGADGAAPPDGKGSGARPEGIACHTSAVAALVDEASAEVRAPRPEIPRSRRGELDRALAQIRQLMQLDVAPPAGEADRAKLASALDELIAWATALRTRMEPGPD